MKKTLCVLALSMATLPGLTSASSNQQHWCGQADLKSGKCQKGDILLTSMHSSLKHCDFSKQVVAAPRGDEKETYTRVICHYLGKERPHAKLR